MADEKKKTNRSKKMKSVLIAGKANEVCEALKRTAQKYKGMTVATYIKLKQLEEIERKQLNAIFAEK